MRCLVFGGSGLLGHELVARLASSEEVSFTYNRNPCPVDGASGQKLDLSDGAGAAALISKIMPDVVFHAAAPPSVDWHEKEKEAAYRINVLGAKAVSDACAETGARLVYISTAFVFPGLGRTYTEEDIPAPVNFYGVTKLGAEMAVQKHPENIIVRTDQIYGWALPGQKKSFVANALEKLERKERVEVCRDWYNSPTYVDDLANAAISLAKTGKKGIYHAVGGSFLDRYEWALKIAEVFGKDPSLVVPIESSSLNLPSQRPNARISASKLESETGLKMKTVQEALAIMKKRMSS